MSFVEVKRELCLHMEILRSSVDWCFPSEKNTALGDALDSESAIDDREIRLMLVGGVKEVFFEEKLDSTDSSLSVDCFISRGEPEGIA